MASILSMMYFGAHFRIAIPTHVLRFLQAAAISKHDIAAFCQLIENCNDIEYPNDWENQQMKCTHTYSIWT